MKANELRIGNIVQNKKRNRPKKIIMFLGLEDFTLDEFPFIGYEEDFFDLSIDEIEPIPLTEEWLLKFGFEKDENNWKCLNLCFATISWERLAGLTFTLGNESIFQPHIKYVHQLQNLYFALTGEELGI